MTEAPVDYSQCQIEAARREARDAVVPMLKERFPGIADDLSVALTGPASFGASDEFSDFDGTVFILDDSPTELREAISRALATLDTERWADVQDPETHFCLMPYSQWGIPLSKEHEGEQVYQEIAPESAWHFGRYVSLYDPGRHLERVQEIAKAYPESMTAAKSQERLRSCIEALRGWESAEGPLSRWQQMATTLCELMRWDLLNGGELYPHEKWLWWWYSREQCRLARDIERCANSAVEGGLESPPVQWLRDVLGATGATESAGEREDVAGEPELLQVWMDLCWQDNCLYHDIMRGAPVSAFIRVGRCLQGIRRICTSLNEGAPQSLDDLGSLGRHLCHVGRELMYLPRIADYRKWRYQIIYAIEALRDTILDRNLLPLDKALKPFC
jgi:hypothetical protein